MYIYSDKMVFENWGLTWTANVETALRDAELKVHNSQTTDIGEMFKASTTYIKESNLWKQLSQSVIDKAAGTDDAKHAANAATYRIKDILGSIPGKVGEKLNSICGTDKSTCTQVISDNRLLALATLAIPLSYYLYTRFKGTPDEKEKLEKRLRQLERQLSKSRRSKSKSDDSSSKSKSDDSSSTSSSTRRRRSSNRKSVKRR